MPGPVKCFVCRKPMEPAVRSDDSEETWGIPMDGVTFDGGNNFGSRIYDGMMDGIMVRLVICDQCLTDRKELLKEYLCEEARWCNQGNNDGFTEDNQNGTDRESPR